VYPDKLFIYIAYNTVYKYRSDDIVEIGEAGQTWEIIKVFNAEYRKKNTTWVHRVNGG
jgi:hypothetical protein